MGIREISRRRSNDLLLRRRQLDRLDRVRREAPEPPKPAAPEPSSGVQPLRATDATRHDARERLRTDTSLNYLAFTTQRSFDQAPSKADEAVRTIREEFSEDVDQDDLENISETWASLNSEEARAAFAQLTPEELDKWGSEAQRSTFWTDNGLTGNQQQALFDDLAGKLDADQLEQVAVAFGNRDRMIEAVRGNAPEDVRDDYFMGDPSDPITVLNLNVGGGNGNSPRSSVGMDPGDVDELAQRIIEGDTDVATLQEVWKMDIPKLEEELERRTGDEWDMHFVEASGKLRWDDGGWPVRSFPSQPFGNAIAVRRGEGVAYSEVAGREKLDSPGEVGNGSDGRSALAVRVHTADGGSFVVGTAHTDTANDIADPEERAREITETRRFVESVADGSPVIVTGDFNHTFDDSPTGDALRDYLDHGYADAGDIGPTSNYGNGRRIDFVFTGPGVVAGDPERLDGDSPDEPGEDHDLADHDGILVDVVIPTDGPPLSAVDIPAGGDFDSGSNTLPDDRYR